ncbi:MAG: GNAT family N-acetyltransferase [Bacteroidetes bacterium]|nr:GNAT family N-acetyltransferase [Bacteroidota bacterium]
MQEVIDPRDIFIKGKSVVLKALTKSDVENSNWYGWFNDEELSKTLQKHYFPNSLESQLDFWEKNILNSRDKLQLGICRTDSSNLLGVVSLNNIDFINRKCEYAIVVGEKSGQNINIFLETTNLIFNHAFNTLNMNRIYGGGISKELVSLMCRSLGCKEEGVSRQEIFKNGEYHDAYRYGILKSEFVFKLR